MDSNEYTSPPRKSKVARKLRRSSGKRSGAGGTTKYQVAGAAAVDEEQKEQFVNTNQATVLPPAPSCNSLRSESEYNLACSSNSSPEHKIHTVVIGAHANQLPIATTSKEGFPSDGITRLKMQAAYQPETAPHTESDQSPDPPSTFISDSGAHQIDRVASSIESSPSFDMATYTNGNMTEMIDIENEGNHIDRERAEFMYGFAGAMSVIQETEEPDDDMTRKSSSMQVMLQGSKQFATPMGHHQPNNRDSGDFTKKHVFNDYSIISPAAVMSRVLAQTVTLRKADNQQAPSQQKPRTLPQKTPQKKISYPNTSISMVEDSHQCATMDSLEDAHNPANQMVSKSSNVTQFKSMQNCGGLVDPSMKSQLHSLTSNAGGTPQKPSRQQKKQILSPKRKRASPVCSPPRSEPKKSSERNRQKKQNGLQLSEYLARQTEKLLNRQSPLKARVAPLLAEAQQPSGPQKVYHSPMRPQEPPNLSNVTSLKNTEICKREKEEVIQSQTYAVPTQFTIPEECYQQSSSPSRKDLTSQKSSIIDVYASRRQEEQMQPQLYSPSRSPLRSIATAPPPGPKTQKEDQDLSQVFDQRLQSLNMDIVTLRDDIKERQMLIYKEVKSLKAKVQLPTAILEEKLDADFMEHALTVYAFFTSCLNMILLNDQEAHKLQLLQPLIEKHITELKLDELSIQANPIDTFEINNDTLSSISPSFNTSYNSPANDTLANHAQMLGQSVSQTPSGKNTMICRGMTVGQRLNLLRMLLQIANQVLSLNSLKLRLINENKGQSKSEQSSQSQELLFTNSVMQQSSRPSQSSSKMIIAPLFINDNCLSEGGNGKDQPSVKDGKNATGAKVATLKQKDIFSQSSQSQSQSCTPPVVSPDRRKPLSPASSQGQGQGQGQQDVYYSRKKGKSTLQQKDATLAGSTRLEDQYSTLTSSKGFSPQTNNQNHRRNLSDGQVAVNAGGPSPRSDHQHQERGAHLQHYNQLQQHRWTDERDESYFQQQAADTYFRTTTSGSPGQLSRRQEYTVTTNGLINLEQVPIDHKQSQSFVTGKTYGGNSIMGDRVTSDTSKQQAAVLHASKRSGRDDSFGVASSSAGSASRNMHQPQKEMRRESSQQKSFRSPAAAQVDQKQNSIMSIKDTTDSFVTALASQKAKVSHVTSDRDMNCNNSFVTGKSQIMMLAEQPSNQRKNSYQQPPSSVKVELEKSSYASPKQHTRSYINDLPDNNNFVVTTSQGQELGCGTFELDHLGQIVQQRSSRKNPKSPIVKPSPDRARKAMHVAELLIDGHSTGGRSRAMMGSQKEKSTGLRKGKTLSMSPPVEPEPALSPKPQYFNMMRQTLKAEILRQSKAQNKASTVVPRRNQSETFSDVSGMSQSRNTLDQIETAGGNKTKISEKSNQLHHMTKKCNSTGRRKKKGKSNTSSYLASFNCSFSQNETAMVVCNKKFVAGDSKVKKALKGVIVAQQQQSLKDAVTSMAHSQSQKQFINTSRFSSNSQSLLVGQHSSNIQSLQSPRVKVQPQVKGSKGKLLSSREHHLKKSSSAKLNISQTSPQKVTVMQSPSHHKITRMGSQATLSPSGQRPARDIPNQPGATKKRMQVQTGSKQSNFLLRQSICINTDKLAHNGSVAGPVHNQTTQSTSTATAVMRKNKSPQSLSQAFNAVAKAISKRTLSTQKTMQPQALQSSSQQIMPLKTTKGSFYHTMK